MCDSTQGSSSSLSSFIYHHIKTKNKKNKNKKHVISMRKRTEDDRTPTKSSARKVWMPFTINEKNILILLMANVHSRSKPS